MNIRKDNKKKIIKKKKYFLREKIKLTGSKGHTSVRIYQKWSKWHIFGHKMTSYFKIGVR